MQHGKRGKITPLYAITNTMENLRFDKEDYFHVLIFYAGYFINEIENIISRVPKRYSNTRGSLGELEIAWKHSLCGLVFPRLQFLVLPNFHLCFYNCVKTRKMFSIS